MKQCTKCKKRKDDSEFSKQPSRKAGLRYWCKKCRNEYERKRYRKVRKVVKEYYSYEEKHRTVNGVKQKRCTKCKKWKKESEFCKDRTSKDGLRIRCRDCNRAYERERYRKDRKSVKDRLRYEQRHRIVAGVKQKLCCRCKKWKDENEFHKNAKGRDGLTSWCKKCHNESTRKRYRKIRKAVREYYRYEESHRTVNGVKQKRCTKCKKWKDESEFYKQPSAKAGLRYWCKKCQNESNRKHYKKIRKAVKKYYRYEERHRIVDGVKQKRCTKCKKWKKESEFCKDRTSKDGLATWCKECSNKATNKARKKRRLAVRK